MRPFLRSWRVWWLALALVAAPQLSFVHALSHLASVNPANPAIQASQPDHERQQAPDKACDTCLSFAHLAQALTAQHASLVLDTGSVSPSPARFAQAQQRPPAHFNARAPPLPL